MKTTLRMIPLITLFSISACNHSDDNNEATSGVQTTALGQIAIQDNNAEAAEPDNNALQDSINALFGDANEEPIPVETGDTLIDVLNRSGS